MSGGPDLLGAPIAARKPGRPKGSTNKRARDLKGYVDARFGGSTAQQAAQLCLVTTAELKAAGGSMAKAQVSKALDLVQHVRQAQGGLDDRLRELVRAEVEFLLLDAREGATAREIRAGLASAVKRAVDGAGAFGLREALKIMADERAALLPYTDQRQPLAVEVAGQAPPAVIVMGGGLERQVERATDIAGEFRVMAPQVSQSKSHDEGQGVEPAGLFDAQPSHGE